MASGVRETKWVVTIRRAQEGVTAILRSEPRPGRVARADRAFGVSFVIEEVLPFDRPPVYVDVP